MARIKYRWGSQSLLLLLLLKYFFNYVEEWEVENWKNWKKLERADVFGFWNKSDKNI